MSRVLLGLPAEHTAFEVREIERLGEAAALQKMCRQYRRIEARADLTKRLYATSDPAVRAELDRQREDINAEIDAVLVADLRAQEAWLRRRRGRHNRA